MKLAGAKSYLQLPLPAPVSRAALSELADARQHTRLRHGLLTVPALRQRGVQLALHSMRGRQCSGRQVPVIEACGRARLW